MWWSPSQEDGRRQIEYSQIQEDLVACTTFDLLIYGRKTNNGNNRFMGLCRKSLSCCSCRLTLSYEKEMDLARPSELAAVPLETWSKLATRIKEQRKCQFLGQIWVRILWWTIFLAFIFSFLVVLLPATVEMLLYIIFHGSFILEEEFFFFVLSWIGYASLFVACCIVSNHLEQKHIDEIFLPSVRGVLSEISVPLAVSGYEAELLRADEKPSSDAKFCRPERWILRFTLLPNDEERIAIANGTAASMPFAIPPINSDPNTV